MISYLEGTVIDHSLNSAIILVGGVGYEVFLPANISGKLVVDDKASFFIYTHVREDILALYGFESRESLEFFKLLLSVSGIGPKAAMAIVASAPLDKLKDSISKGDPTMLSAVSGVGKKTAEKAVVELKGKLGFSGDIALVQAEGAEEIIDALSGLGFQRAEIIEGIRTIPAEINTTDEKIKYLIKNIGKNR
jgi:Holliday junction DNA helicase RuvA